MSGPEDKPLPIAIRVYPQLDGIEQRVRSQKPPPACPEAILVFDTETRTDAPQPLTFGSYRFIVAGRCLEEGIFYGDDLPEKDRRVLEHYVATHVADTVSEGVRQLFLLTRRDFLKKFYRDVYRSRCLLVAFNLPFDLSRIAYDFTNARGRFAGGFSLGLWSYVDSSGREHPHQYRPRIGIKKIDSKRALKGFTARNDPDTADLIPEGSEDGRPEPGYVFRGHFLDLRTLAFALTDRSYSLKAACKDFGVKHPKQHVSMHGVITEKYIDYNRRDVLSTSELAAALLVEFNKHPIPLQATKAYSPASIGKAYLRAMGIKPVLARQPNFPKEHVGYAQTAFFGGRTSAHIRKVPVPVVYTDFLSMYPTVNSLMGLWDFVTSDEIKVIEHCEDEVQELLSRLKPDDLFDPSTWKSLAAFVQVIPDGDALPNRAKYSVHSNDWQVAVNHLHDGDDSRAPWFSLPDIVASVLLTGRIPTIIDAFRIEPLGTLEGLEPTRLSGAIEIDPRTQDFFKVVIEERQRLNKRGDLPKIEKERLNKSLKVLANAASYGIYAEMNRQESDDKVKMTCYGIDGAPYTCHVPHPDVPGEYCFPPFASLITGAARLMLALLEYGVIELGGTYAMEDTDSMAIVATRDGGLFPCPGGSFRSSDGRDAVKALSWEQVRRLSERFASLNPYDRSAVPGSILKIEDDNFDPKTKEQRQLYCLAISAKRYVLFLKDQNGAPVLLRKRVNNKKNRWSEHGLGHLLNPTDPESKSRDWIARVWLNIVRRSLSLPTRDFRFEHLPAIGQISISSPAVMRSLLNLNHEKPYVDQIKPFNFLLTCQVKQLGHPVGADPKQFHLISPYERDPQLWLKSLWIDQYTGNQYRIATSGNHGDRTTARIKTYGEVLREYEFHPESKCADSIGMPSAKQTVGLLQRRQIRISRIRYIGKESNALDEVESGVTQSEADVYTEYPDPRRDEWQTEILSSLRRAQLDQLVELSGLSRSALIEIRAGRSRPHRKHAELLGAIARTLKLR